MQSSASRVRFVVRTVDAPGARSFCGHPSLGSDAVVARGLPANPLQSALMNSRRPTPSAPPFQLDAGVFVCAPFVARLKLPRDVEFSLPRKMIRTRLMRPAKPSAVLGTSSFSHLLTWAR
jgi:hypothetical protein